MTPSSNLISLATSLLALSSLTQARPARFRPSWLYARTGPSIVTLGSSCSTAADCGSDAPTCDFPWIFSAAPFNVLGKVCMLSDAYGSCKTNVQCTTGLCRAGICLPDYSTCVGSNCTRVATTSMPCAYDIDCDGRGRCGTAADVRTDGTSLAGKCLVAGGDSCSEDAECQNGACSSGKCANNDGFGLPAPNRYSCASGLKQGSHIYKLSVQGSDGTWFISAHSYTMRYCLWSDVGNSCSAATDCQSANCLNATGAGLQCGAGADVGLSCTRDVDCHTGRCAGTSLGSGPLCTYQPPGGPCSMMSQCASGLCSSGVCLGATEGATCSFASECQAGVCNAGVCGAVTTTTTTTTATSTSSSMSASASSTSASTSTSMSTLSISSSSSTTTSTTSTSTDSTSTSVSSSSTTPTSTSSSSSTSTSTSTSTSVTTTTLPATKTTTTSTTKTTSKPITTTTTTAKLLPSGAVCTANAGCQSKYCRTKLLSNGTRATTGTCDVPKPSGAACYQAASCTSLKCSIAKGATSGTCL